MDTFFHIPFENITYIFCLVFFPALFQQISIFQNHINVDAPAGSDSNWRTFFFADEE